MYIPLKPNSHRTNALRELSGPNQLPFKGEQYKRLSWPANRRFSKIPDKIKNFENVAYPFFLKLWLVGSLTISKAGRSKKTPPKKLDIS